PTTSTLYRAILTGAPGSLTSMIPWARQDVQSAAINDRLGLQADVRAPADNFRSSPKLGITTHSPLVRHRPKSRRWRQGATAGIVGRSATARETSQGECHAQDKAVRPRRS